eukprot:m.30941 g.30941  ORF g.30941 m.30941 type:complete len:299 (+) comp16369_c1_seq1:2-898(+)
MMVMTKMTTSTAFVLLVLVGVGSGDVDVRETAPEFPRRFSANVKYSCTDGDCFETSDVLAVYQDLDNNVTLWSGLMSGDYPTQPHRQQLLYVAAPHGVDPSTPEADELTKLTWTPTNLSGCSYQLAPHGPPAFFAHETNFFEKHETINGVLCEKWSNNGSASAPPYTPYWAVWYKATVGGASSSSATVMRTTYTDPGIHGSFPVPGFTYTYTFSDFSTAPIPPATFEPPQKWQDTCTNRDAGAAIEGVPGRQNGYLCVAPDGKSTSFTLSLLTKPIKTASLHAAMRVRAPRRFLCRTG